VVEWLTLQFAKGAKRAAATIKANPAAKPRRWYGWFFAGLAGIALIYGASRAVAELSRLHREDYFELLRQRGD